MAKQKRASLVAGSSGQFLNHYEADWKGGARFTLFRFPSMQALRGLCHSAEDQSIEHPRTNAIAPNLMFSVGGSDADEWAERIPGVRRPSRVAPCAGPTPQRRAALFVKRAGPEQREQAVDPKAPLAWRFLDDRDSSPTCILVGSVYEPPSNLVGRPSMETDEGLSCAGSVCCRILADCWRRCVGDAQPVMPSPQPGLAGYRGQRLS